MKNNIEVLDAGKHSQLKVITGRGAEFGENVHFVPVVADELRSLVLDYPIVLMKDEQTGQFSLFALLGFEPGENLYLNGRQWSASYLPLHVRRQPFVISYASDAAGDKKSAALSIDLSSQRVQNDMGELLFNGDGSPSPYLTQINQLLAKLVGGMDISQRFVQSLAELDLIEPAQINVAFVNGEEKSYDGLYTVHEENLQALEQSKLAELHSKGFLQAAYLMLASMGQISKLIEMKNQRLQQAVG
ncbi:SapC family protein [Agaribacterium haliotis]|uniref:SapC family protein n=1 Tax=Agaribacterium haliotis TaxID=2013869 RepID=UPI000BB58301|nr:SapC family protein [Agaribacterium haliotis]